MIRAVVCGCQRAGCDFIKSVDLSSAGDVGVRADTIDVNSKFPPPSVFTDVELISALSVTVRKGLSTLSRRMVWPVVLRAQQR